MRHRIKPYQTEKKNSKIKNLEISLEKKLQDLHPKKIDLSLERINKLLNKLGNPQKKIKNIIHIAGTNGKGSVLAFLKSFIQSSGFTVNTYTSPHLINFNERINIKGKNISNKFLETLLDICKKKNNKKPITFFEITTAAAWNATANIADNTNSIDNYLAYTVSSSTGSSGYSKSIEAGTNDIAISIGNFTSAKLGITNLSAGDKDSASSAATQLGSLIKSIAKTLGSLKAVQERVLSTLDNMNSTYATQTGVVSAIETADLIQMSEELADIQLSKTYAIDVWGNTMGNRKQTMQAISNALR